MPYTQLAKNQMLDGDYVPPTHVAIFDGNPTSGGVELDRQTVAWNAASGGIKNQSANVVLEVEAGETVDHVAYYNGTDLLFFTSVVPEAFANPGTYTLTSSQHHLNNDG